MDLNEKLRFADIPADHQAAFLKNKAEKRRFEPGTLLYKFTGRPLVDERGRVSPWWSGVRPLNKDDPGRDGAIERSARLGVAPRNFARARSAVTFQWNTLRGLIEVRLKKRAWGFVGRCSSQRYDERPEFSNVVWIGGAWQIYLPNLTEAEVELSPATKAGE